MKNHQHNFKYKDTYLRMIITYNSIITIQLPKVLFPYWMDGELFFFSCTAK